MSFSPTYKPPKVTTVPSACNSNPFVYVPRDWSVIGFVATPPGPNVTSGSPVVSKRQMAA